MGLIHPGYGIQFYRQLYSDPAFRVVPPVTDMLTGDLTLLPPAPVQGQAGRPKKGPRVRKRQQSNGEFNSSSRYNIPMSAVYGPLDTSNASSAQAAGAPLAASQPAVVSLL